MTLEPIIPTSEQFFPISTSHITIPFLLTFKRLFILLFVIRFVIWLNKLIINFISRIIKVISTMVHIISTMVHIISTVIHIINTMVHIINTMVHITLINLLILLLINIITLIKPKLIILPIFANNLLLYLLPIKRQPPLIIANILSTHFLLLQPIILWQIHLLLIVRIQISISIHIVLQLYRFFLQFLLINMFGAPLHHIKYSFYLWLYKLSILLLLFNYFLQLAVYLLHLTVHNTPDLLQ